MRIGLSVITELVLDITLTGLALTLTVALALTSLDACMRIVLPVITEFVLDLTLTVTLANLSPYSNPRPNPTLTLTLALVRGPYPNPQALEVIVIHYKLYPKTIVST